MDPTELNRRALAIFDVVCDLPRPEREGALESHCAGDGQLRKRVEQLLEQDEHDAAPISAHALGEGLDVLAAGIDSGDGPLHAPPARIDGYRIVRELGRGGMGVVYEAEQEHPRRRVALKVIRQGLDTRQSLRRFHLEAQTLARLDHPGIAHIFGAGSARLGNTTLPFFVMELVTGLPLDRHVREHQLTPRQVLELVARVCDAVHHAHQREVIHRDLKPGNIMVKAAPDLTGSSVTHSRYDEIGQPKILDFGVARATESELGLTVRTQAGQLIGTLAYMSPEQLASGDAGIDTRCDVYALGVILYELLSGGPPHDLKGLPIGEAARAVQERDPPLLGQLDRRFAGDIETIVARAMDKDRQRRYDSAAALGDDIRRTLRDEPILARQPSAVYQLRKFARRHRALVGGAMGTLVALVLGLASVSVLLVVVADQRDEAIELKDLADQAKQDALAARDDAELAELRATDALRQAQAIGRFQSSIFHGINVAEAGRRTVEEFRAQLHLAARADPGDPERVRIELETVDRLTSRLAGPDLVRFVIDDALLGPAAKRLEMDATRRMMSPGVEQIIREGLGVSYEYLGLNESARGQFEAAIRAGESGGDPAGNLQISLLNRLGLILLYMHRADLAVSPLRAALERRCAASGALHADSLALHTQLGEALLVSGRLDEAEDVLNGMLELLAGSPSSATLTGRTLTARRVLAKLLVERGRAGAALATLEEAEAGARVAGLPEQSAGTGLEVRLRAHSMLEHFAEAEREATQYIEYYRRRRGDRHPWTLDGKLMLADILIGAERDDEALGVLEEVLSIQRTTYPRVDVQIAGTQIAMVEPLLRLGRVDDARTCVDEAAGLLLREYPGPDPSALRARLARARVHLATGDPVSALGEALLAADAGEASFGASGEITLDAHEVAGSALLDLGDWVQAEALARSAIDHHWAPGLRRSGADLLIARILIDSGRPDEARDTLGSLLDTWNGNALLDRPRGEAFMLLNQLGSAP